MSTASADYAQLFRAFRAQNPDHKYGFMAALVEMYACSTPMTRDAAFQDALAAVRISSTSTGTTKSVMQLLALGMVCHRDHLHLVIAELDRAAPGMFHIEQGTKFSPATKIAYANPEHRFQLQDLLLRLKIAQCSMCEEVIHFRDQSGGARYSALDVTALVRFVLASQPPCKLELRRDGQMLTMRACAMLPEKRRFPGYSGVSDGGHAVHAAYAVRAIQDAQAAQATQTKRRRYSRNSTPTRPSPEKDWSAARNRQVQNWSHKNGGLQTAFRQSE